MADLAIVPTRLITIIEYELLTTQNNKCSHYGWLHLLCDYTLICMDLYYFAQCIAYVYLLCDVSCVCWIISSILKNENVFHWHFLASVLKKNSALIFHRVKWTNLTKNLSNFFFLASCSSMSPVTSCAHNFHEGAAAFEQNTIMLLLTCRNWYTVINSINGISLRRKQSIGEIDVKKQKQNINRLDIFLHRSPEIHHSAKFYIGVLMCKPWHQAPQLQARTKFNLFTVVNNCEP